MGKSTPSPPPPPDPTKVAGAQTGSNINTAEANAVLGNANIVGPTGSTTYTQSGQTQTIVGPDGKTYTVPRYTQTTTLSPEQQQLYNQQTQLGSNVNQLALNQVGQLTNTLSSPVDFSGANPITTNFSGDRTAVESALFNRLQPQLDRQYSQLVDKLTNQGLRPGDAGWASAMDDYNRSVNDLRLGITGQGLQEQQGLFGMNQAAHQQQIQDILQQRNQPLNEISALRSGGQVSMPGVPGYNAPSIAPTDVSGAYYNSAALANQNYQQQLAANAAQNAGLFGLGSAGILGAAKYLSDQRLKTDIVDIGVRLLNGIKLYAYRYLWDTKRRIGPMAQEVLAIQPEAVSEINGYLAVRYGAL